MKPATDRQLDYLTKLKYTGPKPGSSFEASKLIDDMKAGKTSEAAAKNLKRHRKDGLKQERQRIQQQIDYLNALQQMAAESGIKCAGFRSQSAKSDLSEGNLIYLKSFLPFDVARRHPELLAIRELDWDERQRAPSKGKFVVRPGEVVEKKGAKGKRSRGKSAAGPTEGCLLVLAASTAVVAASIVVVGIAIF